jgi:hypothetical protein
VLVEGAWDRVRSRLVPLEAGGTVPTKDFLEQPQSGRVPGTERWLFDLMAISD